MKLTSQLNWYSYSASHAPPSLTYLMLMSGVEEMVVGAAATDIMT